MAGMLEMWFWAYVIGVFIGAGILPLAALYLIGSVVQAMPEKKPKRPETALDRWKRGK
jgi:hypothetical protein